MYAPPHRRTAAPRDICSNNHHCAQITASMLNLTMWPQSAYLSPSFKTKFVQIGYLNGSLIIRVERSTADLPPRNWLTQMSCIALMGIKRTVLIPTYQGKKVKLNRTLASRVIVVLRCLHTENRRKMII